MKRLAKPVLVLALTATAACSPAADGQPGSNTGPVNGSGGGSGGSLYGTGGDVGNTGSTTGSTGGISGGGGSVTAGSGGGGSAGEQDSYVNLAPERLTALDPSGGDSLSPPPPTGWKYYGIDGTQCRDGSPFGIYVRFGSVNKLLVYLEGGGACTDAGFCNYNPASADKAIVGTGETVLGSAAGIVVNRQQPGVYTGGVLQGIFDDTNAQNPYKGWSEVYVPYCTGDVHFGSKPNATVPGVTAPQQFVGYSNLQKIIGHVVPTFATTERVVLTGASAGSFGAALNVSMVKDAFGDTPVDLILDSGLPFTDKYMFTCMQKTWRELWGLDASLPPDCTDCFASDGGGLLHLADFEMKKHPSVRLAAVSSSQDEVIRLFFSMGLKDCASIAAADPIGIFVGQADPTVFYPAADYTAALEEVKGMYASTNRLATYLIAGPNITFHEHTFRSRFYDSLSGGKTIASFVSEFLGGTIQQVVP